MLIWVISFKKEDIKKNISPKRYAKNSHIITDKPHGFSTEPKKVRHIINIPHHVIIM